jgi:hypothetical protein
MKRNVTAMYIGFHSDPHLRYIDITVHRDKKDSAGFMCESYNSPTPASVVRVIRAIADQRVKLAQEMGK